MQYILPVLGVIKVDELGFNLFNSQVLAMDIAAPYTHRIDGQVEDLPLLVTQTVADLDNDGAREAIAGSGGYLIHAFSPNGGEPPGWPKYTQKWVMAAPAVGDIDGDGLLEIVAHTREGWLYAWKSAGVACPNDAANSDWWRYHHDERNTGDYGADTQPPSRVTDLIAELLDAGQIRLTFTATGDDWRCGVAASYDLRYSTDAGADLSDPTQFATATALGPQSITTPGGQTATLTVDAPQAAHFALQARDDAGNLSRVSNDAAVGAADDDTTDDDTIDDDTTGDDDAVSDDDADDDQIDDDADDDASTPHAGDDNGGGGCGC